MAQRRKNGGQCGPSDFDQSEIQIWTPSSSRCAIRRRFRWRHSRAKIRTTVAPSTPIWPTCERPPTDITVRAITHDDRLVGTIGCFVLEGRTEVTYWLDRKYWGQGIASRALVLFLGEVPVRPVRARVASDNVGSLRVLHNAGFQTVA
jgi:RimJ/RimL family protein N-acetyltransferase